METHMKMQELNETNLTGGQKQKPRSSGRVGGQLGAFKAVPGLGQASSNPDEILNLYHRLLDLKDQDAGELTGAISYGLKLLGQSNTYEKRKSLIHRLIRH